MASSAATSAAELFRRLSHWRRRRAFHPYGVGFAAELERLEGGAALPAAIDGEAIVRLSRSLGAPEWFPDPCGLALRVPGGLEPAGLLNRLRGPSYGASQEGRAEAYARQQSESAGG